MIYVKCTNQQYDYVKCTNQQYDYVKCTKFVFIADDRRDGPVRKLGKVLDEICYQETYFVSDDFVKCLSVRN